MSNSRMAIKRPAIAAASVVALALVSACGTANGGVEAHTTGSTSAPGSISTLPPAGPNPAIPSVTAFWPSPDGAGCGPGFFDSQTASAITAEFGQIFFCGSFQGEDQWIVITSGMTGTGNPGQEPPATSYGTFIVAVDTCASTDRSCLSPTTTHSFSDFTVYQPPIASALNTPTNIGGTWGGRIIGILDGACGPVLFDTVTGSWFPEGGPEQVDSKAIITAVMTGHGNAATHFPQEPPGENGSAALAGTHPAGFEIAGSFPTTCPT